MAQKKIDLRAGLDAMLDSAARQPMATKSGAERKESLGRMKICTNLDKIVYNKIRIICKRNTLSYSNLINAILSNYVKEYEQNRGEVVPSNAKNEISLENLR